MAAVDHLNVLDYLFMSLPLSGAADVMMTQNEHLLPQQQQQQQRQFSAEHPRGHFALPTIDSHLYSQLAWSSSSLPAWHIPESSDVFRPWEASSSIDDRTREVAHVSSGSWLPEIYHSPSLHLSTAPVVSPAETGYSLEGWPVTHNDRRRFTKDQLKILFQYFQLTLYPTSADYAQIASLAGLTRPQVKAWFRNHRASFRRRLRSYAA